MLRLTHLIGVAAAALVMEGNAQQTVCSQAMRLLLKAQTVAEVKANSAQQPTTPPFVARELRRAERLARFSRKD